MTREKKLVCSMPECDNPPRYGQRYCAPCHAKYMKAYRASKKREQGKLVSEVLELRAKCAAQSAQIEELRTLLGER